ncbi:hypothetical protein EGR_05870 [Echinococcus granulosus]|uniref:Uncharacterized protein n=1 Tax=Echinococcus granulosus TaxID=6210 RepID=W6V000_ECHGR|nr:hypothetical protein EGR_05870 [Echinococcus granulosus]EUB59269.1 hypothetical protein EGR_05870 [Echinococcus granulosus]
MSVVGIISPRMNNGLIQKHVVFVWKRMALWQPTSMRVFLNSFSVAFMHPIHPKETIIRLVSNQFLVLNNGSYQDSEKHTHLCSSFLQSLKLHLQITKRNFVVLIHEMLIKKLDRSGIIARFCLRICQVPNVLRLKKSQKIANY